MTVSRLAPAFLRLPLAHRALHATGRPENSCAAIRAAIDAGYGIEIDVQPAACGEAMVFHDATLDRMTAQTGPVRRHTAAELTAMALRDGGGETIPALGQVLAPVAGQVPLLIEIKDQSGGNGGSDGQLEAGVARALQGYGGAVAVMSFNPACMAEMARLAPDIPRGLVTCAWDEDAFARMDPARRAHLRDIADYARVGACFVSHQASDLARPRVARLKAEGAAILCWTIRSPEAEAAARQIAHNITFEGYLPAIPAPA